MQLDCVQQHTADSVNDVLTERRMSVRSWVELLALRLLFVEKKEDSQSFVKLDSTPGASSLREVCVWV